MTTPAITNADVSLAMGWRRSRNNDDDHGWEDANGRWVGESHEFQWLSNDALALRVLVPFLTQHHYDVTAHWAGSGVTVRAVIPGVGTARVAARESFAEAVSALVCQLAPGATERRSRRRRLYEWRGHLHAFFHGMLGMFGGHQIVTTWDVDDRLRTVGCTCGVVYWNADEAHP